MPTVYTANSKSAAITKAILGACKTCCGSGSGSGSGGGGTVTSCCDWCQCSGSGNGTSTVPSTLDVTIVSGCMGTRTVTCTRVDNCEENLTSPSGGRLFSMTWTFTDTDAGDGTCTSCNGVTASSWSDVNELAVTISCNANTCGTITDSYEAGWNIHVNWNLPTKSITVDTSTVSGYTIDDYGSGAPVVESNCSPFYLSLSSTTTCTNTPTNLVAWTPCLSCDGSTIDIEVTL